MAEAKKANDLGAAMDQLQNALEQPNTELDDAGQSSFTALSSCSMSTTSIFLGG